MTTATLPNPIPLKQDAQTIGLIGLAHGTSHFFHMLLPPLFPWFIQDFGLSYSQLGLLVTVFFIISGTGQALGGFLVDKVGARPVLLSALGCFALAAAAASMAQGYGGLMLAAALAGLGNSPFHPADFTILNKRVSQPRLGHAFSVHGITGNIGWAMAPVFLIGVTTAAGSWRLAYVAALVYVCAVLAVLVWRREAIDDRQGAWAHERVSGGAHAAMHNEHPLAFLRLPSVWLCFSFFFWSTAALSAIQSFASPALNLMYGLSLSATAYVVTGYMLCGAAGMVIGGFLTARVARLERVIGVCLAISALMLMAVGTGALPASVALVVAALSGFGTGLAGPSRDMLIKRAAPPGATGRVYGTVYSGLDIGFALAAPVFGALMDAQMPQGIFYGSALMLGLGVASASLVGIGLAARRRSAAATMAV